MSLSFLTQLENIHTLQLLYTEEVMPYATPRTADAVDLCAVNSMSLNTLYINGGEDPLPISLDDIAHCGAEVILISDAVLSPCTEGEGKFAQLKDISLVRVALEGRAPLKCFSSAGYAYLSGCAFRDDDINCVADLESAEELSLRYMDMSQLTSLGGMAALKRLHVYTEREEHFPPFSAFTDLQCIEELGYCWLMLGDGQIEQLKALYPDCEFIQAYA